MPSEHCMSHLLIGACLQGTVTWRVTQEDRCVCGMALATLQKEPIDASCDFRIAERGNWRATQEDSVTKSHDQLHSPAHINQITSLTTEKVFFLTKH